MRFPNAPSAGGAWHLDMRALASAALKLIALTGALLLSGWVEVDAQDPSVSAAEDEGEDAGGPYRVIRLDYRGVSSDRVARAQLDWERMLLGKTADGFVAPRPGVPQEWVELGRLAGADGRGTLLYASALKEIPTAIIRAYRRAGIGAVRVSLLRDDIDALREIDSDGVLPVRIVEGVIGSVAAKAVVGEETLDEASTLNDPMVARIVRDSPVAVGDLVDIQRLDFYTRSLNRFRHRRVEVGLSPGDREGEVGLDYLVTAVRPWSAYFQVDNTGTPETGRYRERLGWQHRNLTGNDDALALGFITAEFEDANAIVGSYEFPLRTVPLFSARAYGLYSEYDASEVGAFALDFSGESTLVGAEFRSHLWSSGSTFADALLAGEYHRVQTDNDTLLQSSSVAFGIVRFGVELREERSDRRLRLGANVDVSVTTFEGKDEIDGLGRTAADDDWRRLRVEFAGSSDVAGLWRREAPAVTQRQSAHEVSFRVRGQEPLDSRLPPTFTHVAGGFLSVRGYPEGFSSGDRGWAGSLEYGLHIPRLLTPGPPATIAGRELRWRPESDQRGPDWDLVLRAFVDAARVEQTDRLSFERDTTLVGVGLGLDVLLRRSLRFRCDWGVTARDANNGANRIGSGRSRGHFSLVVMY